MDVIRAIEAEQEKTEVTPFKIGDTIRVHYRITEGRTERVQVFEGLCIAMKRESVRKTITVRKMSYGVGVERTFPLNSPKIARIEVTRLGRVRRAKLYYIRDRIGKAAKVPELILRKSARKAATRTAAPKAPEAVPEAAVPKDESAET